MTRLLTILALLAVALPCHAADELVGSARTTGGETVPYVLTSKPGQPSVAVILMPGGRGVLNPRMENGKLTMSLAGNFLIRSRELFADGTVVAASTDATSTPDRILAIVRDLEARYGKLSVYVIGTSRSTEATLALARSLDGRVAGFVHSSSMKAVGDFDPRGLKSRNLVVLHVRDACRVTPPSSGVASNKKYGTDLIQVDGGKSTGDDCEAYAYHGYNGVEADTVGKIKQWIAAR
ncbi:MAG: hypothetical protein LCH95_03265 [Proteobacteria bacterium]|nr:hypothetical protein [Pseudomonadota bacterium]